MSLDVYTHVMPVADVADEKFLSLLGEGTTAAAKITI